MKSQKFILGSLLLLAPLILASQVDAQTSTARITFYPPDNVGDEIDLPEGTVVDETEKGKTLVPEDAFVEGKPWSRENPTDALVINFVSDFNFGVNEISNKDATYLAKAQTYLIKEGEEQYERAKTVSENFVAVTDVRGVESGWKLTVAQAEQLKNDLLEYKELEGSQLLLVNSKVTNGNESAQDENAPPDLSLTPGGEATTVMMKEDGNGFGKWMNGWGTVTESSFTDGVKLFVPGKTPKSAGTYATTLTWTLSDNPTPDG